MNGPRRTGVSALSRLALLAGAALIAAGAVSVRDRAGRDAGTILIEPEATTSAHAVVVAQEDPDASARGFVGLRGWDVNDPRYGRIVAGETAHPFEVAAAGTYTTWVRARWSGTCANSVTLLVRPRERADQPLPAADDPRYLVGNDAVFDVWHWVRGPALVLGVGPHELLLATRESGAAVDCIALSRDAERPPHLELGEGGGGAADGRPFEFSLTDNFVRSEGALNEGGQGWVFDDGGWSYVRRGGLSAVGPSANRVALAEAATGRLHAGRIHAALALSPRSGAGLFFGRDGNDYLAVRIGSSTSDKSYAGRIELIAVEGGEVRPLAAAAIDVADWSWLELEVLFADGVAVAYCQERPVLRVLLPRAPTGKVGLYVDGADGMMPADETVVRLLTSPEHAIRVRELSAEDDVADRLNWPGLLMGYTPTAALAARWTHLSEDRTSAKRLELVRLESSGQRTVLDEAWGIFDRKQRSRLSLAWSQGTLVARLGAEVACSARTSLDSDLVGVLGQHLARGLFGDFSLRAFTIVPGESRPSDPPPGAVAASLPPAERTWHRLDAIDVADGIATIGIARAALPAALVGDLDGDGEPNDVVSVSQDGDDHLVVEVRCGDELTRTVVRPESPDDRIAIQWLGVPNEARVFVAGTGVLARPLGERPPGALWCGVRPGAPAPDLRVARLTWLPSEFFSIDRSWPVAGQRDRVLTGDAMIEVSGELAARRAPVTLELATDRTSGAGYRLEVGTGTPGPWSLRRSGRLIREGAIELPHGNGGLVSLKRIGHRLIGAVGANEFLRWWDPEPLPEGVAEVTTADTDSGLYERTYQPWDLMSAFNQDLPSATSFARWEPRRGEWGLTESSQHYNGYVAATPDQTGEAEIACRRLLNDDDVLAEVRFPPSSLDRSRAITIAFELVGESGARDTVEFIRIGNDQLRARIRRGDAMATDVATPVARAPATTLTVLRRRDTITASVDDLPVAVLRTADAPPVARVLVGARGKPEDRVLLFSMCLQPNPLAADRIPRDLATWLAFLGDHAAGG